MKWFPMLILLLITCSCDQSAYFEKGYYERVTGIKFPKKYTVLTSVDNGEFLTITILDLEPSDCKKFIRENHFEEVGKNYVATSFINYDFFYDDKTKLNGLVYVDSAYRNYAHPRALLISGVDKEYGKVGWKYIIDTIQCRLYCQINYPDQGGN